MVLLQLQALHDRGVRNCDKKIEVSELSEVRE